MQNQGNNVKLGNGFKKWKFYRKLKLTFCLLGGVALLGGGIGVGTTLITNSQPSPQPLTSYTVKSDKYLLKYAESGGPLDWATLTTTDSNGNVLNPNNVTYKLDDSNLDQHFVQIANNDQLKLLENPEDESQDITISAYLNSDLNTPIGNTKVTLAQSDFKVYTITSEDVPTNSSTNVYKTNSESAAITLNNCINLKTISQNNNGVNWFLVQPYVEDPTEAFLAAEIFIPADFSCHLVGTSDSITQTIDEQNDSDEGVVIGADQQNQSASDVDIDIWNLSLITGKQQGPSSATDIGFDIISDVLGDINLFNCTVSDYDTFTPGSGSYGRSECIYIEKILQNGEVNIVGNILRTESPGNMLYSLYVDENNGRLNVENNYLDQYHSSTGNYTYGICVVKTSSTSNIGVSSNVIDSSTDHQNQRCASLFFTEKLCGILTVYNNIFISTSLQGNTTPTNLVTEKGSDENADIIFDSNILIRSGGYQPSDQHQENRPMYMGDVNGVAKIRGTNNLIFDSLSTDPKTTTTTTTTTTITTWYDGYTNENKNITFIGSSSHGSLSTVQYNHLDAVYELHFFQNGSSGYDIKGMINSKISGVKIVNTVIDLKTVRMSADAGSDKNSILSGLLELL